MKTVERKPQVKIERYPAYKDSGVEWLGVMPEHWKALANKHIFRLKKELVGKKSADYVLLSLTLNGVIKRDMDNPQGKFPAEFNTYQEVRKGDFIFCLFDVEETPRTVGLSEYNGMITGAYTVMEPKESFDRRYLYYFYLNIDADKRMKPLYTGLRNTISKDAFLSFKTFVPPPDEQTRIAEFLDKKTTQIDQAIAQKERQIELLKERRQILIHNAVTRGLNPNVKMKDSGVEWIGEIPEHWGVKKLKFTGYLYPGITGKKGEDFSKEHVVGMKPFIPFTNIFKHDIVSDDEYQFVKVRDAEEQNRVKKNDLLFLMSSETNEDIGKNSLYRGDNTELYLNSFCKGFRITKSNIDPSYINYLLLSNLYRGYFSLMGRGFTRINIKQEYVNDVKLLLPPHAEQTQIAEHILTITNKVATAICLRQQEIEKLKEYKGTLINAAVTGKIKV